ncbi:uncharacterized protein DS421_7g213980 [Arachis hypogaea]|nr:uncharacterized protein DS421_7g213980 [Arachis hypogaea]
MLRAEDADWCREEESYPLRETALPRVVVVAELPWLPPARFEERELEERERLTKRVTIHTAVSPLSFTAADPPSSYAPHHATLPSKTVTKVPFSLGPSCGSRMLSLVVMHATSSCRVANGVTAVQFSQLFV